MRQYPATNVAPQFVFDVARQALAALLAYGREEGLELLANDEMQSTVLRPAARVRPCASRKIFVGRRTDRWRHGAAWHHASCQRLSPRYHSVRALLEGGCLTSLLPQGIAQLKATPATVQSD